jgi:hypothetical protein
VRVEIRGVEAKSVRTPKLKVSKTDKISRSKVFHDAIGVLE